MVYEEEKARLVKLRVLIKMSIKGCLVHSQDSFVRSLYVHLLLIGGIRM